MVTKIKTRTVESGEWQSFKEKADQAYQGIEVLQIAGLWHASAESAIRCAIHLSDALCAKQHKKIVKSEDHKDAAKLLQQIQVKDSTKLKDRFLKIIEKKNLIDYQSKVFSESDCKHILFNIHRFYALAESYLK